MTLHDWVDIIMAAVPAFIVALIGLYKIMKMTPTEQRVAKSTSEELEAQTAKSYSEIASQSADREIGLMKNINRLESKLDKLEQQMEEWAKGINKLIEQICDLGEEPVWRPRKITIDEQARDIR